MATDATDLLIFAASAGHLTDVLEILKEGISIDAQNSQGVTALQVASAHGCLEMVEFLLEKSASVHVPNYYGWTPLMLAARYGHHETVSTLLKNNARVSASNKLGVTPIAAAVWNGDFRMVELLLDAGASVDPEIFEDDNIYHIDLSPVMVASFLGSNQILNFLLKKGATVNYLSHITGWSSLMLAACNGHEETAWTLIRWGASTTNSDVCGRNALDVAKAQHHSSITSLLQKALKSWNGSQKVPEKSNELIFAVRDGNLKLVQRCLSRDNLAVNNIDEADGFSLLMIASMNGNLNIVEYLIQLGAQINFQNDRDGWTALMQAVFFKHRHVVQYLLEKGADVLAETNRGCTVLDISMYLDKTYEDMHFAIQAKVKEAKHAHKVSNAESLATSFDLTKLTPTSDRVPRKTSSRSSRLKSWLGSVTTRLNSSHRLSVSKESLSSATLPTVVIGDVDCRDEVFEQKKTPQRPPVQRKGALHPVCSPDRFLANNFRKYSLLQDEIVLPSESDEEDISTKLLFSKKLPPEGAVVSLNTTNLLKNYELYLDPPVENTSHSDQDADFDNKSFSSSKVPSAVSISSISASLQVPVHSPGRVHFKFSPDSIRKNVRKFTATSPLPSVLKKASKLPIHEDKSLQTVKILPEVENAESKENPTIIAVDCSLSQVIKDDCLQKHVKKLKEQEIDVQAFKDLTEEDLDELEIETIASRDKLLKIANEFKSSVV